MITKVLQFQKGTLDGLNPRMVNGHRYVLFLRATTVADKTEHHPTGGPKGIFELLDDGTVLSFATTELDDMAKYNGTMESAFLDAVDKAKFEKPVE